MLDLGTPIRTLVLRRAASAAPYRSLLVLARWRGEPLGIATFQVGRDGRVPRARLRAGVTSQVGARLADLPVGRVRRGLHPGRAGRDDLASYSATTSVSVVVPTCANPSALARCVASVLASDYENFEVIVVENRPAFSRTPEILAERFRGESRVRCVEEPRAGASLARNKGLAHARGEIVAFADDDVVIDPGWLRAGVEAMSQADDIACVTGLILPLELEDETQLLLEQFAGFSKGFERRTYRLAEARRKDPLFPYTVGSIGSGASTFIRTDLARELAGFDTRLGPGTPTTGAEDLDLLIRVLRANRAIAYEPRAIVWHRHPQGMRRLRRQSYRYGVGLGALLSKQLIAGPKRRDLLRAVPAGLRYLRNPDSRKNATRPADFPSELVRLERLGMVLGPGAYLLSILLSFVRRSGGASARASVSGALIASVAAPLSVALGLPSGLRLPAVLAFLCLAPGAAFLSVVRGRHELALVVGISLAFSTLAAQTMLWLGAWQPQPVLYGTAALILLVLITRGAPPDPVWYVRRARAALWHPTPAIRSHLAILSVALLAWVLALLGTDLGRMSGLGLLNALPASYFAAFAVLLVGFALGASSREVPPKLLGAYVVALIVVLHATTALLYEEPRYSWTYPHLGVINLLATAGHADRSIDVYNNWPGFFAANAWLSRTTGVTPIAYAAWAQVFFDLLGVIGVRFALRGLLRDEKLLWTAAFLFVLGNWVGQDYLAPQAFGFTLALVILGLCLRCGRVAHPQRAAPPVGSATAVVAGGLCYLAVVVSHQLTPLILILSVLALALVTRRVPLWVPGLMLVVEAWWVALAWPFVSTHFAIIAPAGSGAPAPNRDLGQALPGAILSSYAPAAVMLAVVGLALAGAWRRLRAGSRDLVPACLIAGPVLTVAFQSYGGEGPYRAFLFALPWLAFFAVAVTQLRFTRLLAAGAAVGGCLLFASFGQELANRIPADDVAAATWYEEHAPRDSLRIGLAPTANRLTARYPLVSLADPDALLDSRGFTGHRLGRADVPRLEALIRRQRRHRAFVILSRAQEEYGRLNGLLPAGSVAGLVGALEHTPAFRLVFHRPTAWVFEYMR